MQQVGLGLRRRRAIAVFAAVLTLAGISGSQAALNAQSPAPTPVAFASTPSGRGFWLAYPSGQVRSFGDARPHGQILGMHLTKPIVGIAATPNGGGYWLVASDGGVFSFGNARFRGSLGALHLNQPIVGVASTPSGSGYWLVASDGGVFSFGDAKFRGSAAVIRLNSPISGLAPTRDGRGYWLVAQDGGVFSFGNAVFHGSAAGRAKAPVTNIAVPAPGHGYWLTSQDGHVFGFGQGVYSASTLPSTVLVGLVRLGDGSWKVVSASGSAVHYREYYRSSDGGGSGGGGGGGGNPGNPPPTTDPGPPPTTTPSTTTPSTTTPSTTTPSTTTPSTTTPSTTTPPTTNPPSGDSPAPPPSNLGSNLSTYIALHGDQTVTVANGTYHAGTVSAPHPATSGAYRGWLVLRAESEHGVVVDLAGAALTLDSSTSRVLFVGFRFVNGSVFAYGNNIGFWYTDHTFPANVWAAQSPNPSRPELGRYRAPRTVYTNAPSSNYVSFYGSDAHDTGTSFMISYSNNMLLQGVKTWNLSDLGLDPQDVVHPDAIGGVSGNTHGLRVLDTWIKGRIMIEDSKDGVSGGPFDGFLFQNDWISNSPSGGFTFTAVKHTTPRGIFGRRVDVRSWDHHNGLDRLEIIDGRQLYTPNTQTSRVNVVDGGISKVAPPAGSVSPADNWRASHPYNDWWPTLFG
ncbi:MAG: Esterase [Actinomycetia bacterium]|nr:Esterase [Actinomycetes bacterium]